MWDAIWQDAAIFLGALHVIGPMVVRYSMRFSVRCKPAEVSLEALPEGVATLFRSGIPELQNLGFELLGCYDCGSMASETRSYGAYFCHRTTNEYASVAALVMPRKTESYLEFSSCFTNGVALDSNTNGKLPLTPENPELHTFRFPKIQAPQALYRIHRQLAEKYAPGLWPVGEPKGEELPRFVRMLENYGPRHARIGYMALAGDGQSYRLTWKGAFLMTWRGLWPTALLRRLLQRHAMQLELDSLEVRGVTAL